MSFDTRRATVAAALVVAGSLAEITGGTSNWVQRTEDQVSEHSMGFRVNALSGLLAIAGALIIAVGVLGRLEQTVASDHPRPVCRNHTRGFGTGSEQVRAANGKGRMVRYHRLAGTPE